MPQPLRIIHCFRSPVGGIFRHVRDLVQAQAAAGHAVGIICDSTTGGELEERRFADIAGQLALGVTRLPIRRHVGPSDLATGWKTFRHLKQLRPDVLHGHGAKGGALARVFGSILRVSRFRVARLYSPHGGVLHFDAGTLKGRALFSLERLLDRMGDQILFVSQFEQRTFHTKIGRPRSAETVVYNGLTEAEFEPVPPAADATDFLFVGTFRDLKGPDIFIDALALASQRTGRRLSGTMVGDSDDLAPYRAQAARLGLEDRLRFLDPMPARQAFALGRIMVVPSRAEAMPYIVLETLAAGLPLIATAVGGIPEILPAGSPALVEPVPESVAAAMALAVNDRTAFAAALPDRDVLHGRFNAGAMAEVVEAAYRSCLGIEQTAASRFP